MATKNIWKGTKEWALKKQYMVSIIKNAHEIRLKTLKLAAKRRKQEENWQMNLNHRDEKNLRQDKSRQNKTRAEETIIGTRTILVRSC